MFDIFAYSPRACDPSNSVFLVLLLMNLIVGILTVSLIVKDRIKLAATVVSMSLLLPLLLWILDGYAVFAQSAYDPDHLGCMPESILSQLARLNYGIWMAIVTVLVSIILGFVIKKKMNK